MPHSRVVVSLGPTEAQGASCKAARHLSNFCISWQHPQDVGKTGHSTEPYDAAYFAGLDVLGVVVHMLSAALSVAEN